MTHKLSLSDLETNDPRAPRGGRERRFLCPFCGDGKPRDAGHRSLSLKVSEGVWICHRCGEAGLLTDFRTERPMQTRKERTRAGVVRAFSLPPKKAEDVEAEVDDRWRPMFDASVEIEGTPGASYVEGRGIPADVAHLAGVRFSPRWYGRPAVLFPVLDRKGKLVAANGRFIDGRENPPHQTGGSKKLGLFGTPGWLSYAPIAIVEAPLDAISLWLCGVPSVAIVGTLWPDWMPSALAFKPVLLATDADTGGDDAAANLSAALKAGKHTYRLRPDGEKDWNKILEERGTEPLREKLVAYSEIADDEVRVRVLRQAAEEGRLDEAEFIASLVEDIYTREKQRRWLRSKG